MIMLPRRTLLAGLGCATTLAALSSVPSAKAAKLGRIGLQLFSVRDVFAKDPIGTLEKLAEIGYREVEYGGGGFEKMDHKLLRSTMDRLGLTAPSLHVSYVMLTEQLEDTITMAKALGADALVLPGLFDEQRVEPALTDLIQNLDRTGETLRKRGLKLVYHNHDFEFLQKTKGMTLFDRFVTETRPTSLLFELDIYWAIHAGVDVKALINRLAGRLYAFHVKDMAKDRSMAPIGAGIIDFPELFRLPGAKAVKHFYVENDEAPPPYFPDVTASIRSLERLRF